MYVYVHAKDHTPFSYLLILWRRFRVLGGLSHLPPSQSTQKVDRKEKPFQKQAAQSSGCSENNQWPSELIESAPCHSTASNLR